MEPSITRRSALGLALAAVPCMTALAVAKPAYADEGSLAATGIADETASVLELQGKSVSGANAQIETKGKVKGADWTSWCGSGVVVGDTAGSGLVSLKIKLTSSSGLTGSAYYQVYKRGEGWQEAASGGAATSFVRNVEAVRINLSGKVAGHYDVLYRVYLSGKGWSVWKKNGLSAGAVGEGSRVNALQVKLSAKTEEASGRSARRIGVRYEAYVRKTGWQDWKGDGKTAGTTGKSLALGGFSVAVDTGNQQGSCSFCAHVADIGWQEWKTQGQIAGKTSKNLEALRIKLTGNIAKKYDVYYRAHVAEYGWLDWTKNGAIAGSTGFALRMEAFQVKLVRKGADAPGETRYPTVNKLVANTSLNGVDIASYQGDGGINITTLPGKFVIVKSTQGDWYTNPYFETHANETLACGKLLGIYHFVDLEGNAFQQANFFIEAVKPYIGKCILVLDWEMEALNLGPEWAKDFLDRVYNKTGVKPLIYMSQSVTHNYDWSQVAPNYRLWVAQYLYRNMNTGYLKKPDGGTDLGYWAAPTMYQYSSSGRLKNYDYELDLDKFYGNASLWRELSNGL